jgi:hypothetical protein
MTIDNDDDDDDHDETMTTMTPAAARRPRVPCDVGVRKATCSMNRFLMWPAALLATASCAAPTGAPPLEAADFVLSGVPLEADSVELRLSFGEPDSVVLSANPYDAGSPLETWYYEGLIVHYDGEAAPARYVVTGGDEATARGIRVGDPIALVQERYGEPDYRHDGVWTYVEPTPEGELYVIEFLIRDDVVVRIHVGRVDQ